MSTEKVHENVTGKMFLNIASAAIAFQNRGGISGQAFTNYTCNFCGQEYSHPNTMTPIFCKDCTKLLSTKIKEMRGLK